MEEADHLRHHQDVKPIDEKRKETIERVFADAYFRCHELEENSQLDLARSKNGLKDRARRVLIMLILVETQTISKKEVQNKTILNPICLQTR